MLGKLRGNVFFCVVFIVCFFVFFDFYTTPRINHVLPAHGNSKYVSLKGTDSNSDSNNAVKHDNNINNHGLVRDGGLTGLVHLMNSDEASNLFQNWHSNPDTGHFLKIIAPWVVNGDFAVPLKLGNGHYQQFPEIVTNCAQSRYSSVLTGALLTSRRWIIDFIAFGYDAEKLLIRLYETFDEIDLFVIYEAPYTLMTARKPLYFDDLRKQPRFQPFLRKIIHIIARDKDMIPAVNIAKSAFERDEKEFREGGVFSVELFQMQDMIRRFQEIDPSTHALKRELNDFIAKGGTVLATQADADELMHREALHHLTRCEIKSEVESVYFPCFSFKSNLYWLQKTFDMSCVKSTDKADAGLGHELNSYLWRLGPYVWPLSTMQRAVSTLRRNYTALACQHHMGYGAAVHLSSFTDPAEHFLKACGTIENYRQCSRSVHNDLVAAGRTKNVTPDLIYRTIVKPWCHKRHTAVHVTQLSQRAQALVHYAIPHIVKDNPRSFPFVRPTMEKDDPSTGLFRLCADPKWTELCPKTFRWPILIDLKKLTG